MRRFIWCGALLMVASAAWLYMAATYACNYPDSYLARCAAVAYRMGTDYNPMYRLSEAFTVRVRSGVDRLLARQGYVRMQTVSCTPQASCPCVPSLEAIAACDPYNLIQTQSSAGECKVPLKIDSSWMIAPTDANGIAANPEAGAGEQITSGVIATASVTVAASAPEDADDGAPNSMPPVAEDAKAGQAPSTMPYVEDDAELLEFWKALFLEQAAKAESQTPAESTEKSEPPQEESENVPTEQPSNGYGMPSSHYSSHPSCPGCERTVTCPYTGRTYPADPRDDTPTEAPMTPPPTTPEKKKKKGTKVGSAKKEAPGKMSKLLEQEKGTENVPVHPEVDTTEYRRGDSRKGEFAPMPE